MWFSFSTSPSIQARDRWPVHLATTSATSSASPPPLGRSPAAASPRRPRSASRLGISAVAQLRRAAPGGRPQRSARSPVRAPSRALLDSLRGPGGRWPPSRPATWLHRETALAQLGELLTRIASRRATGLGRTPWTALRARSRSCHDPGRSTRRSHRQRSISMRTATAPRRSQVDRLSGRKRSALVSRLQGCPRR